MAVCAGEGGTGPTETNGEYTLYLLAGNGTGEFASTWHLLGEDELRKPNGLTRYSDGNNIV